MKISKLKIKNFPKGSFVRITDEVDNEVYISRIIKNDKLRCYVPNGIINITVTHYKMKRFMLKNITLNCNLTITVIVTPQIVNTNNSI